MSAYFGPNSGPFGRRRRSSTSSMAVHLSAAQPDSTETSDPPLTLTQEDTQAINSPTHSQPSFQSSSVEVQRPQTPEDSGILSDSASDAFYTPESDPSPGSDDSSLRSSQQSPLLPFIGRHIQCGLAHPPYRPFPSLSEPFMPLPSIFNMHPTSPEVTSQGGQRTYHPAPTASNSQDSHERTKKILAVLSGGEPGWNPAPSPPPQRLHGNPGNFPMASGYDLTPGLIPHGLGFLPPHSQPITAPSNTPVQAGYGPGARSHYNSEDHTARNIFGISENYGGDPKLKRNRSDDIPNELNCSFWITNLPPNVTYPQLLAHIRNIGRIYAVYINSPGLNHPTAAAKVIFFDLAAAQRFESLTQLGFFVGGRCGVVRKNRIRTAPQDNALQGRSRVIHVLGDHRIANEEFLFNFFKDKFTYQLDCVITHSTAPRAAHVEYRFGSYRCQAETAWIAIERELEQLGIVRKAWGADPCGP